MHGYVGRPGRPSTTPDQVDREVQMGLFRRKRSDEEEVTHCPHCGEPVPEGAVECMMCGVALQPLGDRPSDAEVESTHGDRAGR
jgi:hypothetical protein